MIKKMLKNQKGLTLIELLAVIVILGIIAAIAVPSIGKVIEKTKLDAVRAEAISVLDAAKLAVASEGVPTSKKFVFKLAPNGAVDDPATTNIDESADINDLAQYVDGVDLTEYTVNVIDANTLTIDFTAPEVNNTTIDVEDATYDTLKDNSVFD